MQQYEQHRVLIYALPLHSTLSQTAAAEAVFTGCLCGKGVPQQGERKAKKEEIKSNFLEGENVRIPQEMLRRTERVR